MLTVAFWSAGLYAILPSAANDMGGGGVGGTSSLFLSEGLGSLLIIAVPILATSWHQISHLSKTV